MNIERLYHATPVSGLEAQEIAFIRGIPGFGRPGSTSDLGMRLYEPNAGGSAPLAEARSFLRALRTAQGVGFDEADVWASRRWSELRPTLGLISRPVRLDPDELFRDSECAEASTLLDMARREVDRGTIEFWERVLDAIASIRLFPEAPFGDGRLRIGQLPAKPQPFDLFETMIGLPYGVHDALERDSGPGELKLRDLPDLARWRAWIKEPAARLEAELGTWVYDFADQDYVIDEDVAHRFLALHFLATCLPACPFVRFLVETTGANDVETLRQRLVDPRSYNAPFISWDAFGGNEARAVWCDFRSCSFPKVRAFVLQSIVPLELLREACLSAVGDEVRLVFPLSAPSSGWLRDATRHNSKWSVHRGWEGASEFVSGAESLDFLYTEAYGLSDEAMALGIAAEDAGTKVDARTERVNIYKFFQDEAVKRGFRPKGT